MCGRPAKRKRRRKCACIFSGASLCVCIWRTPSVRDRSRAEVPNWHVWKPSEAETVSRHEKSRPLIRTALLVITRVFLYYSAEIAPVGHAASHAPQSTQASASISYLPSPSEIAPTGHSPSQEPQLTHSSLITCAIV